jgi:hypothetical protein
LGGVHALLLLLPHARKIAAVILILWCSLQISRWQPIWVRQVFPSRPKLQQSLAMYPALTLNVLNQKRLYHELANWHQERSLSSAAIIAGWPTSEVLDRPQSGYIPTLNGNKITSIDWLSADDGRLSNYLHLAGSEYENIYLVFFNGDVNANQEFIVEMLERYPAFMMEKVFKGHL